MNTNGLNKSSLFSFSSYNINHQSYCPTTNKIYFYSIETPRKIIEMDYDGQNMQYLTISNNNAYPDINVSGDSLLYHSNRYGIHNIYLLVLSTMSETQLTYNAERSWRPRWSKVNNGFYYHKTDSLGFAQIMFYNINNGISESIVNLNTLYIHSYCLSPNEDKIALICSNYASYTTGPQDLYIYDLQTSTLTQKTYANLLLTKPQWYQLKE